MIHYSKHPLPLPEHKHLEEWLGHPGRAVFQKYLESLAALLTAEAGNRLIEFKQGEGDSEKEKNENDKMEAELKAKEAERIIFLNELINSMRDKDYEFFALSLSSRPINT